MKKKLLAFITLLLVPFMVSGCNTHDPTASGDSGSANPINHDRKTGEIADFHLTAPGNDFITEGGVTFTWEEAANADNYQIELSSTLSFVTDDEEEVYVKESNLSSNQYVLNFNLPKKDTMYYWRVTAVNRTHSKKSEIGNFYVVPPTIEAIPISIEDEQDWALHKEGSYADISIDRTNFFGNNENSLAIVFDKEHTNQGIAKSDGWIVITKTEDRELYGTDSFYFNFYYSGHDATVLIRVLDYDGEYWHKQVQIANNSKQTILMKYEDFELRTAGGNLFNRVFDWQHIRYFEIVFERTFGDGVCLLSDIKAVKYDDYKNMFMDKMDFRSTDPKDWTYENYDFRDEMVISEDGSEITLNYTARNAETNPNGFSGYGYQNINVYKYFVEGDALRMKVKYTGTGANARFFFRILEEDNDRWQFKVSFDYLAKDDYKELIIPLKAFQRMDYMNGDGAKQFYFIQKFNIGLSDNYSTGSLSIKDLEVIKLDNVIENRKRTVSSDGLIEDFDDYDIYTQIYYYWDQSVVNKDEAMKLDDIHKVGGKSNNYCAEFDYKADMEMATYQLFMDSSAAVGKNAFSIWIKDATPKSDAGPVSYLDEKDVAAEMTIQLTMDTGEWYRYVIPKLDKEWNNYTILFSDFTLNNPDQLFDEPQPLSSEHIIHMAFGFKYLYYDQQGKHYPTYAIANPVYLDEIYFTDATETSIEPISGAIPVDPDDSSRVTIDTMESYKNSNDIFEYWSYATERDYNEMAIATEVSSQGGTKSLRMHYKGYESVSYMRDTLFANEVTAKGFGIDIKGDNKATVYLNLNWRSGTTLYKMRYTLSGVQNVWKHYEIGFDLFKDVNGSTKTISANYAKQIESVSFGIVNNDYSASDIYVDNIRLLVNCSYTTNTSTVIA